MFSRVLLRPVSVALAWVAVVVAVALVGPAAGQEKKGSPTRGPDNLVLAAHAEPADPFSDLNKSGRPVEANFSAPRGSTFLLVIKGHTLNGYYTYPVTRRAPQQESGQLVTLSVQGAGHLQPLYPIQESETQWKVYPPPVPPGLVHKEPFTWTQEIYVKPTAPVGQTLTLTATVKGQVCENSCFPFERVLRVPVVITAGSEAPPAPELSKRLATPAPQPTVVELPRNVKAEATGASGKAGGPKGLFGSIIVALVGGFVSLLTPCVFPMIPITVSYFIKQGEDRKGSPLLMAGIYSGTIVLVLTVGGLILLPVLYEISVHWITQVVLGVLFLVFALSLLGMYDITLPSWLQDFTAAREERGGMIGVFFMALTFSIISFACVGPIYGGFLTLEATSGSTAAHYLQRFLPVLAFAVAFASPFFLLALFPRLLQSMPRAGSWMNSVKVVMGFLELAAVFKFLRGAELVFFGRSEYLTFDLTLGVYVALSAACGLYLLGVFRLPHDHEAPESIGVPRLMFSLTFVALALYLTPGLFKAERNQSQRPRGVVYAWVESFLLPDTESDLPWKGSMPEALAEAKTQNKLVFIDFTGIVCTNCRLNEQNVFNRPEVKRALTRHVLLQLYTDRVPEGRTQVPDLAETKQLRKSRFGGESVPLYALVRPTGDDYEVVWQDDQGLIKDVDRFVREINR